MTPLFLKTKNALKHLDKHLISAHTPQNDNNNTAYSPPGRALGDTWSFVSYALTNKIVLIGYDRPDLKKKYDEMLELFDSDHKPTMVDGKCTNIMTFGYKYLQTRRIWKPGYYNRICYQFDGRSSAHAKNPTKSELDFIFYTMKSTGADLIKLGNHLSLAECVEIMATSDLFLGVDSGMSHVCHSVGIPTYILRSRLSDGFIKYYHGDNKYTLCAADETLPPLINNILRTNKELATKNIILNKKSVKQLYDTYNPMLMNKSNNRIVYKLAF